MAKLRIKRVTVDAVSWTPITVPAGGGCHQFWLRNDNGVTKVRTDSTDANTEDSFAAGIEWEIHTFQLSGHLLATFAEGDTLIYVQLASGTGPVILTLL